MFDASGARNDLLWALWNSGITAKALAAVASRSQRFEKKSQTGLFYRLSVCDAVSL